MPRRAELDRPTALKLMLPESERARLDLYLYSELEGRVPQGAYQEFFRHRIREFFAGEDSQTALAKEVLRWWNSLGWQAQEPPSFVATAKEILVKRGLA